MSACTFFEHRDCYGLERGVLYDAIEELIGKGVDTFYVGYQGQFDAMVYGCLKQLRMVYPHIRVSVVLAYLSTGDLGEDTMYPEIEGHPRYAIDRRNKWMLQVSDYCLCYVRYTWGGAYKYYRMAQKQGKQMLNLYVGTMEIQKSRGGR